MLFFTREKKLGKEEEEEETEDRVDDAEEEERREDLREKDMVKARDKVDKDKGQGIRDNDKGTR